MFLGILWRRLGTLTLGCSGEGGIGCKECVFVGAAKWIQVALYRFWGHFRGCWWFLGTLGKPLGALWKPLGTLWGLLGTFGGFFGTFW